MSEEGVSSSADSRRARSFCPASAIALAAIALGLAGGAASGSPAAPHQGDAEFVAVVALEDAGQVAVLRGPPWRVARRARVPAGPHNVVASPDGEFVAVTSPPAGAVTLIRARSGAVVRTIRVAGGPHDAAFSANGRTLWIAAERAALLVQVAVPSGRVLRRVPTSGGPHDVDVSRRQLWVTIDGSSRVEVRHVSTGRLIARPDLGGAPHDVAVAPNGETVWFSNWSSGDLTVVSLRSRRVVARFRAGDEPHHFAFGVGRLWISDNGAGSLVRANPTARRVVGGTAVGPSPHHVAVADTQILVAVHGSGRVAVVSRRGRVVESLAVGLGPRNRRGQRRGMTNGSCSRASPQRVRRS